MKKSLTIYRSSAGSGKTFTLVFSYLKIVVREPNLYRNVLAITFTNKATDEMKSRIIKELSVLAKGEKSSMYDALCKHFEQKKIEVPIFENASTALTYILKDYGNFSVCTIESFCQRVIRAFAKELNVPLGYDIEMRNEVVLNRITDDVFLEAGQNPKLTRLLQGFLESKMDQDKTWKIDREVKELGQEIFKEHYQRHFREKDWVDKDYIEEMLHLSQAIAEIRRKFEDEMKHIAQRGVDKMRAFNIVVDDFAYKSKGGIGAYFEKIADEKTTPEEWKPGTYVNNGYEDFELMMGKTDKRRPAMLPIMKSEIQPILKELVDYYNNHLVDYVTAVESSKTIYTFGLLNDLQKKLTGYRRENRQLLISDTNQLLNNLLQGMDTPFVYEKLGNRYAYYLIDEFQDTSEMQWENLYPLLQNALASIYDDESMIVGDVKQSIYRWRGGDLMLLLNKVEKQVTNDGLGDLIQNETLANNWRTAADIVNFNNEFFIKSASLLAEGILPELKDFFNLAYEEVQQVPQRTQYPGYVSIEFFEKKGQSSSWKQAACERTLDIIRQISEDGYKKSDITILVRSNKEAITIAEYLQENQIKITSAESLLLANHPVVKMLVALLHYLQDGRDTLSGATAGYYYHLFTKWEEPDENQEITSINYDVIFQDTGKYQLPDELDKTRHYLLKLPLYECVEQLLRLSPRLMETNVYVQGFLDAVLDYNSKNDGGITGFLAWWEEVKGKRYVVSAADPDAVQIMTVHKSKGLEFPIVIMPFASWSFEPKEGSVFWIQPTQAPYSQASLYPLRYSKKLEDTYFIGEYYQEKVFSYLDNLNILYVAFTRPEYRLYILTDTRTKGETALSDKPSLSEVGTLLAWVTKMELENGNWNEFIDEETQAKRQIFTFGKTVSVEELNQLKGKNKIETTESEPQMAYQPLDLRENWKDIVRVKRFAQNFVAEHLVLQEERVSVGNLVHTALGYVTYASDVTHAISVLFQKGQISESQCIELQALLERVVKHPIANEWFAPNWKVRTEMELLGTNGKVYRPDRILLQDDIAYVIDYKTGIESENDIIQVRRYMKLLQRMKYKEVRGFLFYLLENKVVEA